MVSTTKIAGIEWFYYCLEEPSRWAHILGHQVDDEEYGSGRVTSVRHREDQSPLISIDFDDPADFDGDSFLEPEVAVWVATTDVARIRRAYKVAQQQKERDQQAEEARASAERERRLRIIDRLLDGFSLWHMTHLSNLPSILDNGLLSHSRVHREQIRYRDISEESVQHWRERNEAVYSRPIHSYVPLYINPRNAMLFRRRQVQHELCMIEISRNVILDRNCVVTDGNAAARRTKFFRPIEGFENLDWTVLRRGTWYDDDEAKRIMCAEVLVPNEIGVAYIESIRCIHGRFLKHIKAKNIPRMSSPVLYFL
jgi:hypothetical protein